MKTNKIIKYPNGRITFQTNSVNKIELKVRIGENTSKLRTNYKKTVEVENVVDKIILLSRMDTIVKILANVKKNYTDVEEVEDYLLRLLDEGTEFE